MKKADVVIGSKYVAKISGKLTVVVITADHRNGGWVGKNDATGREVRIRTAAKLRKPASEQKTLCAVKQPTRCDKPATCGVFCEQHAFEAQARVNKVCELFGIVKAVTGVDAVTVLDAVGNPTKERQVLHTIAANARQEAYPEFLDELGQDGKTFAEFLGGQK